MPIDYKQYPENWKEMRQQVLDRVGHCCEHCGVSNYAVGYRKEDGSFKVLHRRSTAAKAKATKKRMKPRKEKVIIIVLTIAHLDHDEWNHEVRLNRLAALCQKCHFAYDRVDNINRKAYGKQYGRYQVSLFPLGTI